MNKSHNYPLSSSTNDVSGQQLQDRYKKNRTYFMSKNPGMGPKTPGMYGISPKNANKYA